MFECMWFCGTYQSGSSRLADDRVGSHMPLDTALAFVATSAYSSISK